MERFTTKILVDSDTGCWVWTGAVTGSMGYGSFYMNGRKEVAHRAAYMLYVGPIPDGFDLDHLCRNPLCANPEHVEPVTQAENNRRQGEAVTHCPAGHPYDEKNTYHKPRKGGGFGRYCRRCRADGMKGYKARKKAEQDD